MNNLHHEHGQNCTADGFVIHPAIRKAIAEGDIPRVFDENSNRIPLNLQEVTRPCRSSKTFTGLTLIGDDRWVWFAVTVESGSPRVRFWSHQIHGGTQTTKPLIERRSIEVHPGWIPLDQPGQHALPAKNGQGTKLRHWVYDYDADTVSEAEYGPSMESTRLSPADPTQTGVWDYFGVGPQLDGVDLDGARELLYAHGRRPGMFIHATGRPVLDVDEIVNGAYLYNGETFHTSAPPSWIAYTDPRNPWKDVSARDSDDAIRVDGELEYLGHTIHNQDQQHMTQAFALAEAGMRWPDDEGFRWLLQLSTSTYLLQVHDEGLSSQARALGRAPLTGFRMADAFEVYGDEGFHQLALGRAVHKVSLQAKAWVDDLDAGRSPLPQFGSHPDAVSPNECGIWYSMMPTALAYCERHGWPKRNLETVMRGVEKYCFDAFRLFPDVPGERGYGIPYFTGTDKDGNVATTPTTALFVCLAAVNHRNDPEDAEKMAAIRVIYEDLDPRYKL